jgi:hypothetical protein
MVSNSVFSRDPTSRPLQFLKRLKSLCLCAPHHYSSYTECILQLNLRVWVNCELSHYQDGSPASYSAGPQYGSQQEDHLAWTSSCTPADKKKIQHLPHTTTELALYHPTWAVSFWFTTPSLNKHTHYDILHSEQQGKFYPEVRNSNARHSPQVRRHTRLPCMQGRT